MTRGDVLFLAICVVLLVVHRFMLRADDRARREHARVMIDLYAQRRANDEEHGALMVEWIDVLVQIRDIPSGADIPADVWARVWALKDRGSR